MNEREADTSLSLSEYGWVLLRGWMMMWTSLTIVGGGAIAFSETNELVGRWTVEKLYSLPTGWVIFAVLWGVTAVAVGCGVVYLIGVKMRRWLPVKDGTGHIEVQLERMVVAMFLITIIVGMSGFILGAIGSAGEFAADNGTPFTSYLFALPWWGQVYMGGSTVAYLWVVSDR